MQNIVFLVIDAFNYLKINQGVENMPFMKTLMEKSVTATNMYSQAPYTEAALMALLGGQNTLDKNGYMRYLIHRETIMDAYKKAGARVFLSCYQPNIYVPEEMNCLKDKFYQTNHDFFGLWDYRLSYFANLYEQDTLRDDELELAVQILDDGLSFWYHFMESMCKKSEEVKMVYNFIDDIESIEAETIKLKDEIEEFNKDKKSYLMHLFKEKKEHALFKIKVYPIHNQYRNEEFVRQQNQKFQPTFERIKKLNKSRNLKNNHISIKKIRSLIRNKDKENLMNMLKSYVNAVIDKDLLERNTLHGFDRMKGSLSIHTQIDFFMDWLRTENAKGDPYFAYLHCDDIHYPEFFFSYDTKDELLLDHQFEMINDFLDKLPKNYKGNLAYDLSLLYIDDAIHRFFDELDKNGYLENTAFVVTADHGNSYGYTPIRENYVINFYDENYHIPFVLYSKKLTPQVRTDFYSTIDIPYTLLKLNHIKIPDNNKGIDFLGEGRDYVIHEFMGAGCPDMQRRNVLLGVKSKEYKVILSIDLKDEFDSYELRYVFDLKKDKDEQINLYRHKNIAMDIQYELTLIKQRFQELKEENVR